MLKAISNMKKIYALFLVFSIVTSALIVTPLSASANSNKKKENKIADTAGEWQQENGTWHFIKPDGEKASNEWIAYDGLWYYLKPNGMLAESEWVQQGDARYFIKSDATMAENQWVSYGNSWYWLKPGGKMAADEWLEESSGWYRLKSNGKMAVNEKLLIDGKNHNFGGDGIWIGADLTREQIYAAEVFRLTNIEREKYGLLPLAWGSDLLHQAAMIRATEEVCWAEYKKSFYPHLRPDGRECGTAYTDIGGKYKGRYKSLGENLAWGYGTASAVVQGWMNSPGHRDNILHPGYTHLGVGMAYGSFIGGLYKDQWVQMFYG